MSNNILPLSSWTLAMNTKDLCLGIVTSFVFAVTCLEWERAASDLKAIDIAQIIIFELFTGITKGQIELLGISTALWQSILFTYILFWGLKRYPISDPPVNAGRYFVVFDPQFLWNKPTWIHPFIDVNLITNL